jgi:ABC-type phosphate/phosphonate transport system permease subunit
MNSSCFKRWGSAPIRRLLESAVSFPRSVLFHLCQHCFSFDLGPAFRKCDPIHVCVLYCMLQLFCLRLLSIYPCVALARPCWVFKALAPSRLHWFWFDQEPGVMHPTILVTVRVYRILRLAVFVCCRYLFQPSGETGFQRHNAIFYCTAVFVR